MTNDTKKKPVPHVWHLGEYLNKPIEKPVVLLAPWLTKGSLWLVHAAAGVGKTYLTINIAYAVASGGKFLCWKAQGAAKVLYVDGEMEAWEMQERLNAIVEAGRRDGNGDARKGLQNFTCLAAVSQPLGAPFPDLATEEGLNVLLELSEGMDLVIIDNLSTTMRTGEENESSYWMAMQDTLVELRKKGTAVLLVHHSNKSGGQRGTSTKDVVLNGKMKLDRPKDYAPKDGAHFVLEYEKSRGLHGEYAASIEASMAMDAKGRPKWEHRVIDHQGHQHFMRLAKSGEYANQKEIADAMGLSAQRITQIKQEAINDGLFTAHQVNCWLAAGKNNKFREEDDYDDGNGGVKF